MLTCTRCVGEHLTEELPCAGDSAEQPLGQDHVVDLPEAMQVVVCNKLPLASLARLATVSKLWAELSTACITAKQERLKALVAEAPPGHTRTTLPHSLLYLIPTHLPPTPSPRVADQSCWTALSDGFSGFATTWNAIGWPFYLWKSGHNYMDGFRFGSSGLFRVRCFSTTKDRHEHFAVAALLCTPKDKPQLLGLLLVLLQDQLPRLLEQANSQQNGGPAPSPAVSVVCNLSFGTSLSMWAPLAPLLRELQFYQAGPCVSLSPDSLVNFSPGKRVVF